MTRRRLILGGAGALGVVGTFLLAPMVLSMMGTTYVQVQGVNTGDVQLSDAGGTSNFQGASILPGPNYQNLQLSPSDGTHPGVVYPGGVIPGNQTLDGGWFVLGSQTVFGDAGFLDNVAVLGDAGILDNETVGGLLTVASDAGVGGNATIVGELSLLGTALPQLACTGNADCELQSNVASGSASGGAFILGTANTLSGSTDNLFSLKNGSTQEVVVSKTGIVTTLGKYLTSSTSLAQFQCTGTSDCGFLSNAQSGSASAGAFQFLINNNLTGSNDLVAAFTNGLVNYWTLDPSGDIAFGGGVDAGGAFVTSSNTQPQFLCNGSGPAACEFQTANSSTTGQAAVEIEVFGGQGGAGSGSTGGGAGGAAALFGGNGGLPGSTAGGGGGGQSFLTGGLGGACGTSSGAGGAGGAVTVQGGIGGTCSVSGVAAGAGANVTIEGGNAGTATGGANGGNGGNVTILGGSASGAGTAGVVKLTSAGVGVFTGTCTFSSSTTCATTVPSGANCTFSPHADPGSGVRLYGATSGATYTVTSTSSQTNLVLSIQCM